MSFDSTTYNGQIQQKEFYPLKQGPPWAKMGFSEPRKDVVIKGPKAESQGSLRFWAAQQRKEITRGHKGSLCQKVGGMGEKEAESGRSTKRIHLPHQKAGSARIWVKEETGTYLAGLREGNMERLLSWMETSPDSSGQSHSQFRERPRDCGNQTCVCISATKYWSWAGDLIYVWASTSWAEWTSSNAQHLNL